MFVAVLLGLTILLIFLYSSVRKPKGYPPGPVWLPVVGCIPLVQRQLTRLGYTYKVWSWLSHLYGPVVGLKLGTDHIILVHGYDVIREVLGREDFDGRPDGFFFRMRTFGERLGIVFSDGPLWHEQRRFCLQHLRHYGYGKRDMEEHIQVEAMELVTALRAKCENPLPMHDAFDISVLNSLWAMFAGKRFALDDKRLEEMMDLVHSAFRMMDISGGLLNQMPFLRFVAPERCGYNKLTHIIARLMTFLRETVSEHQADLNSGEAHDLIDSFLQEMKAKQNKDGTSFSEHQLLSLGLDLFMAGSETTSNTLGFAVLCMLLHPRVQTRVQDELDAVVGRDRQPTFRDRTQLRYVEAVLMEVQRLTGIVPTSIPHRAVRDTKLRGYTIPQGCTMLMSLNSVTMDEDHWGDPEVFRPERFLDSDSNLLQDDWFMPFGYGRRRCLGESLAKSNLFLFFSSIFHNFTLTIPPDKPAPSLEGYDGVTLSPKPFYALLTPRN